MDSASKRGVFINCPFDATYKDKFNAIIFTIYDCGFIPRCALEYADSGAIRFIKICNLIKECHYGIHDISRVQLDAKTKLPRFNMPFELGLYIGAKTFGNKKGEEKVCLVMDTEKYRYQKFCSDLAGTDIEGHSDKIQRVISVVRDWLSQFTDEGLRGDKYIFGRYERFLGTLPIICRERHLDRKRIIFRDYVSFS
jgi:hypothetical protein